MFCVVLLLFINVVRTCDASKLIEFVDMLHTYNAMKCLLLFIYRAAGLMAACTRDVHFQVGKKAALYNNLASLIYPPTTGEMDAQQQQQLQLANNHNAAVQQQQQQTPSPVAATTPTTNSYNNGIDCIIYSSSND